MKTIKLILLLVLSSYAVMAKTETPDNSEEQNSVPGALYARNEEAKFRIFLPLKKTDVKLWVSAGIVHAEVTQVFTNTSKYPLEAIYVFPLPSQSTVTDMVLEFNERIIRSVVKERKAAKKVYEKAKKEGKKTALVESERPNVFTTSVANFLPGETVKIKISYIEPIAYQEGRYEVNFPMVVGPRYIPFDIKATEDGTVKAATKVADADRITPPLLHPSIDSGHRLTLNAEIEGIPIREINSNTHAIKVKKEGDNKFLVSLKKPETRPNKDFNIKLLLNKTQTPTMTSLASVNDDQIYRTINIFPPVKKDQKAEKQIPREVIFLIDTSGSMSGASISQAKAGLKYCMQMLKPGDKFTIVRFADNYSSFSPDLRKFSKDTVAAAESYIEGLQSSGGTEMQKALKYVLELAEPDPESMQMIVFLTDGDVGNEDSLLRLLKNKLGRRRLYTFGIGSAPNEFLMRKMAEEGRGQCRFIHSHEDIGTVMGNFFKTLSSPILTDIAVAWIGQDGEKTDSVTFFPNPCPDVFSERPLTLYANYPVNEVTELQVTGKVNGHELTYKFPIDEVKGISYPSIEKLFGQAEINQLMLDIIMRPSEEKNLSKKILDIALRHQLVTKYTSRVAVEEKVERKPDGTLVSVNVPTELPEGWNPKSFFSTASNNPLLLLLGSIAVFIALLIQIIVRKKEIS